MSEFLNGQVDQHDLRVKLANGILQAYNDMPHEIYPGFMHVCSSPILELITASSRGLDFPWRDPFLNPTMDPFGIR